MYGSSDNNLFIVDNAGDVVIGTAAVDTVETTVSYVVSDSVEALMLKGSAAITGTGNALNNRLDGSLNAAANLLVGGRGDDRYTAAP